MHPLYDIRNYSPQDFPQVENLWIETGMGGAQRGDTSEVVQQTIDHGGVLLVMVEKTTGLVVGTSWLTNDFRRLYLHHFGILPAYQGKGLANHLLNASLAIAKEKNLQIKLEVHKDNTRAIKLYHKHGFAYLGDYLVYIIRDVQNLNV